MKLKYGIHQQKKEVDWLTLKSTHKAITWLLLSHHYYRINHTSYQCLSFIYFVVSNFLFIHFLYVSEYLNVCVCSVQSGSNSANKRDTMKMTWDDDLQLHIDYVYGGGVWCSVLTECQWGKKEWNWSVPLAKGYNQLCLCFHVSMPIIMHECMMQSVYYDALFLRVGVGCSYMNLFCSYVCMYVCVCVANKTAWNNMHGLHWEWLLH